jgi:predicted DNA-binding protein (MmcQ/YjbR family)
VLSYEAFNSFCAALPVTTHVVQWGGADVWKVGGKVFAVGGWAEGEPAFTIKTSADDFDMLTAMPGVRPAPYLASRGMTWVQHYAAPGIAAPMLKDLIEESHRLVSLGLTKKLQRELGLNQG